jgi:hypothetical protein
LEPVPTFDLYAELEVSPSATTPTIDAAWKSLMKRNHPDLGGARAAGRTVRLNIAHDWLTDPVRRSRYDDELRTRSRTVPGDPGVGRVAATPARPASTRPTTGKPPGARSSSPPPNRARHRQAHATAAWRDRRRWGDPSGWRHPRRRVLVAIGALAVMGGLGMLAVIGGAGTRSPSEVTPPPSSAIAAPGTLLPSTPPMTGTSAPGTSALGTPTPVPTPGPSTPGTSAPVPTPTATHASSPATATLSLSGAGDHEGVPVTLTGGRYEVSYDVSSPAGESCPWALYLTGSNGLDLLVASAYPVDETVRDAASNSFIPEGKAVVRVESGCPHWSATITRTGP